MGLYTRGLYTKIFIMHFNALNAFTGLYEVRNGRLQKKIFATKNGVTVLPRITPQGSYFFELVKKGELFDGGGGVIRGMGSYYFESVILQKRLCFLLNLAFRMAMKTEC